MWLLVAAVYVVVLTALLAGGGAPIDLASPRVWLPHVAAIAASLLASWAAFASVIPGHSRRPAILAVVGALAWFAAVVVASRWHSDVATIVAARHEMACVGVIVLGGAPVLVAMAAMLRRGATFTPGTTAAFAALAIGALTNIGALLLASARGRRRHALLARRCDPRPGARLCLRRASRPDRYRGSVQPVVLT